MNRALNFFLVAGVFSAGSLTAQDGLAQHTTPFTTPPAPPPPAAATAPAASRQAVVLVAMTGDPATDEQLRATADALKQRLQARGYGDTDPTRLNQALAADPAGVATLRSRLGAGCMVRVDVQAHDNSGVALLVTVQSDAGEKAVPVQSSKAEIVAKVIAATEPLLPTAPPAAAVAPPPAAVPTPPPAQVPAQPAGLDRVVLMDGTVLEGYLAGFAGGNAVMMRMPDSTQRTIPWDQVKQIIPHASADAGSWNWAKGAEKQEPVADWSKRGGSLLTMDVQGQIVGVLARLDHPYVINYPDGQQMTFTGDSPSGGGGAGIGFHIGFMQLEIPNPSEGSTLLAFRMGTGIDVAAVAFAYRTPNINTVGQMQDGAIKVPLEQEGGETQWNSASVVMLPLFLGGQIGSGEFIGAGLWRGVMFGLDWRPTYTYVNPADLEGIGSFNYLGMAAHVDMGSINANRDGLESNFRISVTYLPTIDRNPSYASLGFGAVWY
jgi:hypothetical protein